MTVAGALMPWADVATLAAEPSGLYEVSWRDAFANEDRLEVVMLPEDAAFVDCGTPQDYLEANLTWSGGASVIGAGAVVGGRVDQSVVWPGAIVHPHEHLVRAIRASNQITVLVR
jgi:NDP-sugar pyrophosphorylase family protein